MRWILATATVVATAFGATAPAAAGDGFLDFLRRLPPPPHVRLIERVEARIAEPCRFIPGRWEERVERVVVREGRWERHVEPALYAWRWDPWCGRHVRVLVRAERVREEWIPAVVEERRTRVWVAERWECGSRCHGHAHARTVTVDAHIRLGR